MNNNENNKNKTILKFFFFMAIIVIPAAVLYFTGAFHFFLDQERLKAFLDSLGIFSYLGFVVLQIFQVIAAPIPGEATGFLGGFLYGIPLGIFLSTLGLTLGSWLAFKISKIFGRPLVEKVIQKETIDRYDYLLHSKGLVLIFLLFLFPGFPKDYLSYILGLGHMSTRAFLIVSTLGRFMGTAMLTIGGSYIRNGQFTHFFTLTSIVTVIVILAIMYRDKIEERLKKWHLKSEEN
jgi:uncharacterized membrane protein YdjX (TVP38/TMEM64 family)